MAKRQIIIPCAATGGIHSPSISPHQLIPVEGSAAAVHEAREIQHLIGADKVEF